MPKFLILRFSSIGDIVLTSPVARCIKLQIPNAEVHFFTKKQYKATIENNKFIDKKIYLSDNLNAQLKELQAENYDYIIDLHKNIRTFYIKLRLGKKSFSFDKLNYEKWLLTNFKINKLPNIHIVDRYLNTVKTLGVKNDIEGLDYFLPDELNGEAMHIIQQLEIPFEPYKYVAFAIGAQHATKRLPNEKIISICKKLNQPIVLLGGKEDMERAAEITTALQSKTIYNACGKLSLPQSAGALKLASSVITHDTGLMHIAAAFNKKIISVWGNTVPEFGMTPYFGYNRMQGSAAIIEVKGLNCRPCSKLGYNSCPKKHFKCMLNIDEAELLKQVV